MENSTDTIAGVLMDVKVPTVGIVLAKEEEMMSQGVHDAESTRM